jgi:hypothetical protein
MHEVCIAKFCGRASARAHSTIMTIVATPPPLPVVVVALRPGVPLELNSIHWYSREQTSPSFSVYARNQVGVV